MDKSDFPKTQTTEFLESRLGNVQKSPSRKAAAFLAREAYCQYVSTRKRRERRWRLFSTFPRKTNLPGGYQLHEVGPNSKGGQLTISSDLFGRQFRVIRHPLETNSTSRLPALLIRASGASPCKCLAGDRNLFPLGFAGVRSGGRRPFEVVE